MIGVSDDSGAVRSTTSIPPVTRAWARSARSGMCVPSAGGGPADSQADGRRPVGPPAHGAPDRRVGRLGERDVRAVHDTCTHQQQPLHEGAVDGDTLVCAAHAATFDLSTGDSVGVPEVAAVPMYACKVEDDAVLVDVDALLNEAEPG